MEQQFDKQIEEIKEKNKEAIWKLFNEFKQNLEKVEVEFTDSKETSNSLKQYYDEKLLKQEDEHEFEIIEIEENHKKFKKEKEYEMNKLVSQQTEQLAAKEKEKQNRQHWETKATEKKNQVVGQQQKISDGEVSYQRLEEDLRDVVEKLKDKETELYKYKFKIKDLRKSKHVLTSRAQEMRQNLKPKDEQIDQLKDQLANLEEVLEREMQRLTEVGEKVNK